jgi:hypothetical protein
MDYGLGNRISLSERGRKPPDWGAESTVSGTKGLTPLAPGRLSFVKRSPPLPVTSPPKRGRGARPAESA